jgi:hypothetical protein
MKRIFTPVFSCMMLLFSFTSCAEESGESMFNTNPMVVKNTITPTTPGDYNRWLLGNIGQYGYLQTENPNNFSSWSFYIICSGGNFTQVAGSPFHWAGSVDSESLTMDATIDNNWNEWVYTSITYNTTYYIKTTLPDNYNGWSIYNENEQRLFEIKTTQNQQWNRWEIVGEVPESHQMNLVGLFFIPVYYATTQPVIG